MKSNKQQGFTLIELIIVIVILGILAVTASPKFLDLTGDARESSIGGLEGAIKGATNIIYSKAIIDGKTKTNDDSESVSSVVVAYGYPESTQTALSGAAGLSTADWDFVTIGTETRIYPAGDYDDDNQTGGAFNATAGRCYVSYTESASDGAAPTIATSVTDCG